MDFTASLNTWIVVTYLLVLLVMAFITKERIHSLEDYAVGGRSYPAWVLFATLCATLVGGGFTIGNAEKIYTHGIIFTIAMAAIALREILIAYFIAPHMSQFRQALSIGDIMNEAYGMPAKIITGLFAAFLCAGMIGIPLRAMGYIFQMIFNVDLNLGILLGSALVIFYVMLGGFKAVVWTDVFQFAILIIALPLTGFLAVQAAGGPGAIIAHIPVDRFDLWGHYTPLAFISMVAYFLIGEALAPPYVQRLLAGDAKAVSRAALWTGITSLPLGWVVAAMALATLALNPSVMPHEVIPYLISSVLPIGIAGFVMAAMLAVFMSSADSFLNAAAVNLIHDVVKPLKQDLNSRAELWLTQLLTLCVGLAAIVFAMSFGSLVDSIIKVYGLWAPIILVPLVAAVRGYRGNMTVFLLTVGSGLVVSTAWDYHFGIGTEVSGMLLGTCAALIVFLMIAKSRLASSKCGPTIVQ